MFPGFPLMILGLDLCGSQPSEEEGWSGDEGCGVRHGLPGSGTSQWRSRGEKNPDLEGPNLCQAGGERSGGKSDIRVFSFSSTYYIRKISSNLLFLSHVILFNSFLYLSVYFCICYIIFISNHLYLLYLWCLLEYASRSQMMRSMPMVPLLSPSAPTEICYLTSLYVCKNSNAGKTVTIHN